MTLAALALRRLVTTVAATPALVPPGSVIVPTGAVIERDGRTLVAPGDTVLVGGHLTLTHDAPIRVRLQEGARTP